MFLIFTYLVPKPKAIYHLRAQDAKTLTYSLYATTGEFL